MSESGVAENLQGQFHGVKAVMGSTQWGILQLGSTHCGILQERQPHKLAWSRCQTTIVNIYGGFVLGASSRLSNPNPKPMAVITASILCLVQRL